MDGNSNQPPNYQLDLEQTELARQAINKAQIIGIISHRYPDPDTIGSNLALREFLENLGKQVHSFCVDLPPSTCTFLQCENLYSKDLDPEKLDLIISVDCGSGSQTAFIKTIPNLFQIKPFINIDHHASNELFGQINLVNPQISSTSEIIFQLLNYWQGKITARMATLLLFGLYYDTGSFMHSNTTPKVLEMASKLTALGANLSQITTSLYRNFSEQKYQLWGHILSEAKLTEKKSVVGAISLEDQIRLGGSDQMSGVIDYLSMVPEADYAVFVSEDKLGQVKGSLRTRKNDVNVSSLAETLNGGGHKKASGFGFPGHLEKSTIWQIIPN